MTRREKCGLQIKMFDRIYCINLDRRPDRWAQFQTDYPAELPRAERWPAVDGNICKPPSWWPSSPARYGCYASHLGVIEKCLADGVESVLVFEDDATSREGFSELWPAFQAALPENWNWLYLGGSLRSKPARKVNSRVYVPQVVGATHAMILRRDAMQMIHRQLIDHRLWMAHRFVCVDKFYQRLHLLGWNGLYCPAQWLFRQSADYSDLINKHVEYVWPDACDVQPARGKFVPQQLRCDPAPFGATQFHCKRKHCQQTWTANVKAPICRERRLVRQVG